jgi:hypothetical protein
MASKVNFSTEGNFSKNNILAKDYLRDEKIE